MVLKLISQVQQQLTLLSGEIEERTNAIAVRESQLTTNEAKVAAREAELNRQFAAYEKILDEKFTNREVKVAAREKSITQLQEQIAAGKVRHQMLREEHTKLEAKLEAKAAAYAASQNELGLLKSKLGS